MTIAEIKSLLAAHGLAPNRALGQNFLADKAAASAIAEASGAAEFPVLEIGPGLGALTEPLLCLSPHVTAVEIDASMVRVLQARFANAGNFTLPLSLRCSAQSAPLPQTCRIMLQRRSA